MKTLKEAGGCLLTIIIIGVIWFLLALIPSSSGMREDPYRDAPSGQTRPGDTY